MREPAASQIIAGKYRLESLIGYGGMGSVWRAQHVTLGMPVAIKFMGEHAVGDPESRQRFDREARALASLRTPHIVQVLDHGVDDDTPYIVMELLEGEDLSTRLLRERRLPLGDITRILAQTARALRRAHEAGITHRDLKPSNIFLARIDDEPVVKVLDFGVAKLAAAGVLENGNLTKTGTLLGSPGYMSPEQARGKEVDFRSDLWALAVIVFRAVTGVKPFAGDSIAELVIKLCIDPRPVASRLASDVPPAIDRFFEKAFAGNPEDRYGSAVEMASAFAQIVGQPGLELSRTGPSPVAGLSPAVLDAPAAPLAPLAPLPPPSAPPLSVRPATPPVTVPAAPPIGPPSPPPAHGPPTFGPAPPLSPRPVTFAGAQHHREPTPTPASFAGFAPSLAETASAPPGAGPTLTPPSSSALRAPPVGAFAETSAVRPPDPHTPPSMRLPAAAPPDLRAPTHPSLSVRPAAPPAAARPTAGPKVIALAAAGAALLAVLVALAISGLRGGAAADPSPGTTSLALPPAPTDAASSAPPAPTSEPAPPATAGADPSATPSADPAASADPSATADPAASADPAPTEPLGGPTVVEGPVGDADPAPTSTQAPTTPRPATSAAPTTRTKPPPSTTSSAKKKGPKPNFGY